MADERKRRQWLWFVLTLLVLYVAGYFVLTSESNVYQPSTVLHRRFVNKWIRDAYWPLGWLESKVRGTTVIHICPLSNKPATERPSDVATWFDP